MIQERALYDEQDYYLYACLSDPSGIDQAELTMVDEKSDDKCFRVWDFQYAWFNCTDQFQIDQGSRSLGKAIDVREPILTLDGWKTMGTIQEGDYVFNELGHPVRVTSVFDVMYDRPCYEITFSDGAKIVADEEHEWSTWTHRDAAAFRKNERIPNPRSKPRVAQTRTTLEIKDTLLCDKKGTKNHKIDVAQPLQFPKQNLPLSPYTFGFWLGDGTSSNGDVTIGDEDLTEAIFRLNEDGTNLRSMQRKMGYKLLTRHQDDEWEFLEPRPELSRKSKRYAANETVFKARQMAHEGRSLDELVSITGYPKATISNWIQGKFKLNAGGWIRRPLRDYYKIELQDLGVLSNKHIPRIYLEASVEQRLALLQGLMDTDGHCTKGGECEITLANYPLIIGVYELIMGLGQKPTLSLKKTTCNGVEGIAWRVTFFPNKILPFRFKRKANRVISPRQPSRITQRRIHSIEKVESVPVRCISVEGPSHLYLVGTHLIPTHNSMSIQLRCLAFPFTHPGGEMVVTAPEATHLSAVMQHVETIYRNNWLAREMLIKGGKGVTRKPWMVRFHNGAEIKGLIPQLDGKGLKGCVEESTLILTKRGIVEAKDVVTGDEVWSHLNRWSPVLGVQSFEDDGFKVTGIGANPIIVNAQHKFYGKRNLEKSNKKPLDLSTNTWAGIEDLDKFYWACPRLSQTNVENQYDLDLAWIMGNYAAEGYLTHGRSKKTGDPIRWRVNLVCHPDNQRPVLDRITRLGLNYTIKERDHSSADIIEISSKALAQEMRKIGRTCYVKQVPIEILLSSLDIKRSFYEGYEYGDGSFDVRGRVHSHSASKKLSLGIAFIGRALGFFTTSSSLQPKTTHICGVKLKKKPALSWKTTISHKTICKYDDDYSYGKIKSVTPLGRHTFINIISSDHSYLSDGVISHNSHPLVLEMDEACFPGDTLILTSNGQKPISEIQIGDSVFTHKNRWRQVTHTYDHGVRETVEVTFIDGRKVICTPNHHFRVTNDCVESWVPAKNLVGRTVVCVDKEQLLATSISPVDPQQVYDIEVEDDHSFIAEGIAVHNSDFPELGWVEIFETLFMDAEGSQFRAHGVTRGVQDSFHKFTQPDSVFTIHHYPAMFRPTWNEHERQTKIKQYGSVEDSDYRRNIFGVPGDSDSPLFVAYMAMSRFDPDLSSEFNTLESMYTHINDAMVRDNDNDPLSLIDIPPIHKYNYKHFWIGSDLGFTVDPTVIVIFGEYKEGSKDTVLRMIGRIKLTRLTANQQAAIMEYLIDYYRPLSFAMDITGNGLPIYQILQDTVRSNPDLKYLQERIKGYNFSEKIIVDFDDNVDFNESDPNGFMEAAIKRGVVEASFDALRNLVDTKRIWLPWDEPLQKEFLAAPKFNPRKPKMDHYGRNKISKIETHTLDACRMAALAYSQRSVETMLAHRKQIEYTPTIMVFDDTFY